MLATKRPNIKTNQTRLTLESVMKQLVTVYHYEEMTAATDKMIRAKSSPAVVIDGVQKCIGILTRENVQSYFQLWIRFLENDESVLPEIFETNAYGMLNIDREFFHQVGKHMTCPVVEIDRNATCADAEALFQQQPGLQHLVVMNDDHRPIGVLSLKDLTGLPNETVETVEVSTACLT